MTPEDMLQWLKDQSTDCDCAAWYEEECACGAFSGYKMVAMPDLIERFKADFMPPKKELEK